MNEPSPVTRAVRAGIETDKTHGAVVAPIFLSTTYTFAGFGEPREFDYSRRGNPTRALLADAIAGLEHGAGAVVTGSGMGAITTVLHAFTEPGDLLVAPHDCYGGSWRLFDTFARKGLLRLRLTDLTDPAALDEALAEGPRLVWIETPSNPLMRITDIAAVAAAAHAVGALVVADNTFCSPVLQQPLDLGADIVVHSTTKYLNGHSDVVSGVAVAKEPEVAEQLVWWANCLGLTGGAFDSYLALRGLRTLQVRMRQHGENAAALADLLAAHPAVARVHYPGLPSHPGHDLAASQQQGFGGMISAELVGGAEAARRLMESLTLFCPAESLGGVESLINHPGTMTHASMPPEVQAAAGITPGMVRLSIGIEDVTDLVADLSQGLARLM